MRGRVITAVVIGALAGTTGGTNPKPRPDRPASPEMIAEAHHYSQKVLQIVETIRQKYVRNVAKAELIEAALAGLYDAARQPLPSGLRQDLAAAGEDGLADILIRHRLALADEPTVRGSRATLASLSALPRALDPHCGFGTAPDVLSYYEQQPYGVFGLGIEFANAPLPRPDVGRDFRGIPVPSQPHDESKASLPAGLLVKTVVPGSPAQRAGLRPGDVVVRVGDRQSPELDLSRYYRVFYPSPPARGGQPVEVHRPGHDAPLVVSIAANFFTPESVFGARRAADGTWDYLAEPATRLGYVRLGEILSPNSQLGSDTRPNSTADDFHAALNRLRDQGARGLVLDLRWCPRGILHTAIQTAMCLLPSGSPVARQVERRGQERPELAAPVGEPDAETPLVVLIGGDTSGAGELIAAALQDHRRAVVAGERTRGKASVQTAEPVLDGALRFRISTGTFVRPSGKNLQRHADSTVSDDWGVRPDPGRWLPVSPERSRQLREWWALHALRPAASRDALPTDDPEADPQLRAALDMLRSMASKPGT